MSDYLIECATKEEWAARAFAAEARIAELEAEHLTYLRKMEAMLFLAEERAEAEEALNKELLEALGKLLQVQDGLPMTGMEATKRADKARAAIAKAKGAAQ